MHRLFIFINLDRQAFILNLFFNIIVFILIIFNKFLIIQLAMINS